MTAQLLELLRKRVSIIGDHPWRDRDPAGHLEALKNVSGEIDGWAQAHQPTLHGQMRHYLKNASYQKALEHLELFEDDKAETLKNLSK